MKDETSDSWLQLVRRLHAIAQTGLTFANDPYDIERYQELRAIANELLAINIGVLDKQFLQQIELEAGYATPKIDVRGVVFNDNKILMVRERQDNKWTLPGGYAEVNLSAAESCEKEILDESGFIAKAKRVVALFDASKHPHPPHFTHFYKIFILCDLIGGEAKTSIETSEVQFFAEHELPVNELSLSRILPQQLTLMFDYHRNPELATLSD